MYKIIIFALMKNMAKEHLPSATYKIVAGFHDWLSLNILLLCCMIVMRPIFFGEVYFRVGLDPIHFFTILSGAVFDLLLVCRIFTYGLIPFLGVHFFFPKVARGVYIGLTLLYGVVNALLAEYYCNLTMPLDHVILVYSLEDLKTTVLSSASLSFTPVLWFVAQMVFPVLLVFFFLKKTKQISNNCSLFVYVVTPLLLVAAVVVPYNRLVREERLYPAHYDFCLAVNQPSYSFIKIMDYMHEKSFLGQADSPLYDESIMEAVEAYHAAHPEFEYDDPTYPFYRKATDPDVLGPFFKQTSDGVPPNVVFIIVEGLGRRLTAMWEPMLSFTPFIDSLASEGLFWPQCLSTAERTFGVLPSVFASAPHGRYGFSTTLAPTPRHNSLLRDFERNGYYTSFYYGGDMSFDHYDFFMKSNHVDYLFAPPMVVEDSAHYRLLMENHRWGLDDDQLVGGAIQHMMADSANRRPFVDIYLTLSTHEPFLVDSIENYEVMVRERVENTPNLTDMEKGNVLKNIPIFACYLYLDGCIRRLMDYYASRSDYDNTVFIITGDHRMAPLPFGRAIRKYNVPLIIYSPLLTRTKQMEAVVSHLDITPSINAFLHANYDYAIDDHCHWLGTSFDTVASFRNTRKLMFMLNNRDVVDYCDSEYIISNRNLYHLDSLLVETTVEDPIRYQQMKKELDDFDIVSRFVVQSDLLLPKNDQLQLYSCHLDFDRNTLVVFDKYRVKDSAFLYVEKEVEAFELCPDIAVGPIYDNLTVEVSFDIRSQDTTLELPFLIVSMGETLTQLRLSELAVPNTGRWEHGHARIPINVYDRTSPEALKIFLWKRNRSSFYLDNLVVSVTATQRE